MHRQTLGCLTAALLGVLLIPRAGQAQMDPSLVRKLSAPSKEDLAFLKTFDRNTEVNPTHKLANVVFASHSLERGVAAEKSYKLKKTFAEGEEIHYRAYRPARHIDLMNRIAGQSISRGCQVEIRVSGPDGADIAARSRPIEQFDYPELDWSQSRGKIVSSGRQDFSPPFESIIKEQGPGNYTVRVFVFDKISKGRTCERKFGANGQWGNWCRTVDPVFYLVASGSFSFVKK